jgi:predicted O-methyltransferase YrrM
MKQFTLSELEVKPVKGPFSKYMTPQETAILIKLIGSVSPKVVIEFGCNLGITARRILDNVPSIEKYIGIDVPSNHKPVLSCQIEEVSHAPGYFAHDDRFQLLIEPSQDITLDKLEPCDAAFIDGDHSYDVVSRDSLLARHLLRPGGIICWHDYNNPSVHVTEVISELCANGWPIHCVENSWLAFMRRPS